MQRVWIALELKGIPYQYIEVDPYEKPQSLLEVNPRGLVPALRHDDWGCYESNVLLEYVREPNGQFPIFLTDQSLAAGGFGRRSCNASRRPKAARPLPVVGGSCK